MKLVLTNVARNDLAAAFDHISQDSPTAAGEFLRRFDKATVLLTSDVVEGRQVTLLDGRKVHAWSINPYRIYYRRIAGAVEVIRVYHSARKSIER